MQDLLKDAAVEVAELLKRFSFDLNELAAEQLAFTWLDQYPADWVHLSLVEALYQGRYKAVSIEQILRFWQRRGQPLYHFNHEFERIIRGRFSRNLLTRAIAVSLNAQTGDRSSTQAENAASSQALSSKAIEEIQEIEEFQETGAIEDNDSAIGEIGQLPGSESSEWFDEWADERPDEWSNFSVVSTAVPASDEAEADLLEFTDPAAESAIQPFRDRLKLLSSEESIAFLKLRSFENGTPSPALPQDASIQAFRPLSEFEAVDKPKWAKLAIEQSSDDPFSTEQIHQFIPVAVSPGDFYSKLKAVAGESCRTDASGKSSVDETDS